MGSPARTVPGLAAGFGKADSLNHRIQKFDSEGHALEVWGRYGRDIGQFDTPEDVAVDSLGNVYVADKGNHRVQKFARPLNPVSPVP